MERRLDLTAGCLRPSPTAPLPQSVTHQPALLHLAQPGEVVVANLDRAPHHRRPPWVLFDTWGASGSHGADKAGFGSASTVATSIQRAIGAWIQPYPP